VLPRTRALVLVLVVPGCFNPHYLDVRCGQDGACPGGVMCNMTTGFCEPPGGGGPGGGSDAGSSVGSDGGSGGTGRCLQRWLDGGPGLVLSQPQELALATTAEDRDPWISADGLRLYFDRKPGLLGGIDIYVATRTSTAVDFTTASAVFNLDTPDDESRAALSGDETLVVFSGNHNTTGRKFQLFVSRRSDSTKPFPSPSSPDQVLVASVNTAGDDYFDPFLSSDSLRLYVAPVPAGSSQEIRLATRAALDQNFGPAAPLAVINSGYLDADPALSPDERVLVFTSLRPAGAGLGATNLWYSTRPSATADFAPPNLIPAVNGEQDEGDPVLSADGCELYFASRRTGGAYHLFRTQVVN
jgi:hypothetical protein